MHTFNGRLDYDEEIRSLDYALNVNGNDFPISVFDIEDRLVAPLVMRVLVEASIRCGGQPLLGFIIEDGLVSILPTVLTNISNGDNFVELEPDKTRNEKGLIFCLERILTDKCILKINFGHNVGFSVHYDGNYYFRMPLSDPNVRKKSLLRYDANDNPILGDLPAEIAANFYSSLDFIRAVLKVNIVRLRT